MSVAPWAWLGPLAFFLMGSVPTGYLLGRARGIDVRQKGSGNIGATNVWRVLGWRWGALAFAGDFLKGFGPLLALRLFLGPNAASSAGTLLLVACAAAVVIGHNYTPFLGFKGGKGIATSAGVLGALLPLVLAAVLSTWIVVVALTRVVSLGSVIAALALPGAALLFYPGQWIYFALALAAGTMAIWRHRANLRRLRAGTEPKLGAKSAPQPSLARNP